MDTLPIYEATISPEFQEGENELGMTEIAFTHDPAIMVKGVAFKNQKQHHFADEKKYRITAPAMIPMDIYRADEDGEYEVRFTEEVIEDIFVKFMQDLKNNDLFNLEHNDGDRVPAYILEAWLVDNPKEDKAFSTFGLDVPKGTLMLTTQITEKDFYNKLVESGQYGYSIEAFLGLMEPTQLRKHKYNHMLPNGVITDADGNQFTFENGEFIPVVAEVQEEVATEEAPEVVAETTEAPVEAAPVAEVAMEDEEEQEEMAAEEEVVEETVEEEMAVDPELDAEAVMAIVQPMFDEVLSLIAEIKQEIGETAEEAPAEDAEVTMSASHKFSNVINFLKD